MNSLDQTLARAVIEARLAAAGERRRAREAARARRTTRWAPRWAARRTGSGTPPARRVRTGLPWRRRTAPAGPGAPTTAVLRVAVPPAALPVADGLDRVLQDVVARVTELGTGAERRALAEVAAATRTLAPGAAAALVDRQGSEVARLRALGLLHGVALRDLTDAQQARLLTRLDDRPAGRSLERRPAGDRRSAGRAA